MPTSGEVTTRSDRMRNFKMFWDIFKKILKVEFQLRTWGVLLGLSNTAGVLAGVFGTAATEYILQKGIRCILSMASTPITKTLGPDMLYGKRVPI
ncbi:hypothetical protein LOK49_LG13G01799 [Camellia lanceoleosa]|uniref:Uncharacterized protein n=1 Tax=Camellia lanceoleosa TaxID=1840588 RepID=A0ACC0FN60_9ERIC|nr:hypothetical protein LOK49_LG13G01799 [Camellia lanceoleosa]